MITGLNVKTFPLFTFLSAGLINLFIPSGGGQWVAQGPIVVKAAQSLNIPLGKAVMALAWGDAWTNMIQPFWALPILGLAKLSAKDIMGYCLIDLIYSGIIIALVFLIL
ncbi:Short chain fatty acid transporter [Caloramator fervidus]|uniref:Short chain fatty acid transporter n=1 Tax=Caloramator fervidus TaxID=29344 RepID=A0A1H5RPG1_9CLOT|nr:Short chain fatty acid transporter [Caloramator fervidus]